jgi:hypothetical protein
MLPMRVHWGGTSPMTYDSGRVADVWLPPNGAEVILGRAPTDVDISESVLFWYTGGRVWRGWHRPETALHCGRHQSEEPVKPS